MGPRYRQIFVDYVKELRAVGVEVSRWWSGLVTETVAEVGDPIVAATELLRRWPVGPVAHPRVLAIVRKYYLACEQLNKEIYATWTSNPAETYPHRLADENDQEEIDENPEDLPLNPVFLVGEALFTPGTKKLATDIGRLTYWPIGMDEKGNRV
jgi:hypothetical protein